MIAGAAPYLQSWLQVQRAQLGMPGVQAAVRVGRRLVFSTALGLADVASGEALRCEHVFRVASQSKWVTATALLALAEAGRLRLDDTLGRWLPQLADRAPGVGAVTVRRALGHTGAVVRDGRDADYWVLEQPFPHAQAVLDVAAERGSVEGTDERFGYSNIGYALLGLVIEAVTGASFAGHVQREVLDRLAVGRTTPDVGPDPDAGLLASGHAALLPGQSQRRVLPATAATSAMAPAVGLVSTAQDMTSFAAASWTSPGLLSTAGQRLQREPALGARDDQGHGYGLGVELDTIRGRELVGHAGAWPGQISRTFADPGAQIALSVCTNAADAPAETLARGLLALVDLALAGAARHRAAPPDQGEDLVRHTGRFANLWQVVDVALLGGRLLLLQPSDPDPWARHSELTLVDGLLRSGRAPDFGSGSRTLEQERDEAGAVTSVRIGGITHQRIETLLARGPSHEDLLSTPGPQGEAEANRTAGSGA